MSRTRTEISVECVAISFSKSYVPIQRKQIKNKKIYKLEPDIEDDIVVEIKCESS